MPAGRPTKYKFEYCKQLIAYFAQNEHLFRNKQLLKNYCHQLMDSFREFALIYFFLFALPLYFQARKSVQGTAKSCSSNCKLMFTEVRNMQLIQFFDVEPYSDVDLEHFDKDGNVKWVDKKRMANRLPTLRNFAKSIQVSIDTVYEWIKQHEEFSDAFTHAKDLQKWFLIENGLNSCYNPMFAIFTAKNITDMRDKQEIDNRTEMHLTGFEKLNDEQLDGVLTQLKNQLGESSSRESQETSRESS